jgi:hypothetical protein
MPKNSWEEPCTLLAKDMVFNSMRIGTFWAKAMEKEISQPLNLPTYKGHTLQGNYEGAFVYAKESLLPEVAVPAVRQAVAKAGLNFNQCTQIDNTWYTCMDKSQWESLPSYSFFPSE